MCGGQRQKEPVSVLSIKKVLQSRNEKGRYVLYITLSPSFLLTIFHLTAVQNERDRISCRRPSYEENNQNNGLSVNSLLNAEMLSRQVGAALEVAIIIIFPNKEFHFAFYSSKLDRLQSMTTTFQADSRRAWTTSATRWSNNY